MGHRINFNLASDNIISERRSNQSYSSSFIDEMLESVNIVDVLETEYDLFLEENGNGWFNTNCPLPGHDDSSPSFGVNPEKGTYHCFGCLEQNELIWSLNGLVPIKDIKIGDSVIDRNGQWKKVTNVESKKSDNIIYFETGCFRKDPLMLTKDHDCLLLTENEAFNKIPYIVNTSERGAKFFSILKKKKRSRKFFKKASLSKIKAEDVSIGDFWAVPILENSQRKFSNLKCENIISRYKRGPKNPRITSLPVTLESARLYGLWLAEGSCNRGWIRFTYNINEKLTLAKDTQDILKSCFGLKSTMYIYENKNTVEINCSNTDLSKLFPYWFGKGCNNKKIPIETFSWPQEIQKSLFEAWFEGDSGYTTSKSLAYGMFNLGIQSGKLISLSKRESYISKSDGRPRRESWNLRSNTLESLNGFIENLNGTDYYLSRVTKKELINDYFTVVDISVDETKSFVTKMGVVHNCNSGGNLLNFIRKMEGLSFREGIQRLMIITGMSDNQEEGENYRALRDIDWTAEEFLNHHAETQLPGGMSAQQFMRSLADRLRKFELKVNFNSEQIEWADSVYALVDDLVMKDDEKGLCKIWKTLGSQMSEHLKEYIEQHPDEYEEEEND